MADRTAIEWTDATWNPLRGCSRVSAGCQHCYAERVAARFSGPGMPYERLIHPSTRGWNGTVRLVPEVLDQPLRWKRPRRIFVNSMSDLFHESVANEVIAGIFGIMAAAPQHTFQILTKRPQRALAWFQWHAAECKRREPWPGAEKWRVCEDEAIELVPDLPAIGCKSNWPLPNVWLGVSVENQAAANERIPLLLQCPAAVRWLSCEPLLGHVNLGWCTFDIYNFPSYVRDWMGELDWLVAGGESGPGARPMHPDWARSLRDQCATAGVPFLFKQWGEWVSVSEVPGDGPHHHFDDGATVRRIGKRAAGRLLDGVEHNGYPEVRP